MRYSFLFVCYFLYMKEGTTPYIAVDLIFVGFFLLIRHYYRSVFLLIRHWHNIIFVLRNCGSITLIS